ncbi:MAG: hypothetical protein JOY71_31130 [Acetobacteraceae bacterium]|nr:hypothetical protein [Acetobacteraceae bacterium]
MADNTDLLNHIKDPIDRPEAGQQEQGKELKAVREEVAGIRREHTYPPLQPGSRKPEIFLSFNDPSTRRHPAMPQTE